MWLGLVIVILSPISMETDRTADTLIFVNRTLQSYCPYMNFCHRNATQQLEYLDDKQGPCCTPCSCDDDCVEFDNCCPDKDITHIRVHTSPLICKSIEVKKNAIVEGPGPSLQFRVVDKCATGEKNETLIKKCSDENRTELYDYIWVSDTESGRVFQNHYCARCHGIERLEMWNVKTYCMHIFPTSIQSFTDMLLNNPRCNIINVVPDHLASVTRKYVCVDLGQSDCEEVTANQTLLDACARYALPFIMPVSGHLYRNVFCLLCIARLDSANGTDICYTDNESNDFRTQTGLGFLLNFKDLNEDSIDTLQCDTDAILDIKSNQCLRLRCPWGMVPVKGECTTFMLPASTIEVAVNYYLRIQWEDTDVDDNSSLSDVIQLRNEVLSTFLKRLKYRKHKCLMCLCNFNMMPPNGSIALADFVFVSEIQTTDSCPMDTLFDLLSGIVGEQIIVKYTGASTLKVSLRVSLISDDDYYSKVSLTPGFVDIESYAKFCAGGQFNLRYIIPCPQVEITKSVIQSITDKSVKETLGFLFNETVTVGGGDGEAMFMCVEDYFKLVNAISSAGHLDNAIDAITMLIYVMGVTRIL